MPTISAVAEFLERFGRTRLAADWDNVGLLVGDRAAEVRRIMTCLTVTAESVAEAVAERADLIVTHHPLPFRPLRRLTSETPEGRHLLALIAAGIGIYSPHTAFDSAGQGINQRLAEGLTLTDIRPLMADALEPTIGVGRHGTLSAPLSLESLAKTVARFLGIDTVQIVGLPTAEVRTVAIACGSAGELLADAQRAKCDAFVTGEARFHTCLEAEAMGIALVLTGHFASERFAVEQLANVLGAQFAGVAVWACRRERDPLRAVSTDCL